METKAKKKPIVLIVAAVAVVAAAAIAAVVWFSGSTDRAVQKQLDIAQQYMDELNYEQAAASYLTVIELDADTPGAYLGAAEAYAAQDDYERAIDILAQGHETMPDEALIQEQLAENINSRIDALLENESYDEIHTLAEQYSDAGLDVDFDTILAEVEEAEAAAAAYEEKHAAAVAAREAAEAAAAEKQAALEAMDRTWIDDLYGNLVSNNYQAVLETINAEDFLENCELFLYEKWAVNDYETAYRLQTSDGKIIGVVSFAFDDGSSEMNVFYAEADGENGFVYTGYGDHQVISYSDGSYDWFDGRYIHYSSGRADTELGVDDIYYVWHV